MAIDLRSTMLWLHTTVADMHWRRNRRTKGGKSIKCRGIVNAIAATCILQAALANAGAFEIQGFNINMYGKDRLPNAAGYPMSIDQLVNTGSNTVMVTTPYFQSGATSNAIYASQSATETDEHLAQLFDLLRSKGFRVAYKFTVIPEDGSWSGAINPSNPALWFASYRDHLTRLASLAEKHGVTLFYIANELQSMANAAYRAQWDNTVDSVRDVYTGDLAWNAVLNARGAPDGEAFSIPVVSRLDHIGLSLYEPLTRKRNPSVEELVQAWRGINGHYDLVSIVKDLHRRTQKPVVFSEISYRGVDGNNIDPADWQAKETDVIDAQEQADCYEAFMRVWTAENESWMLGVIWWQWTIEPILDRYTSHDQTPQNHPAQQVVTEWFGGSSKPSAYALTNQSAFGVGEVLSVSIGMTNPGISGMSDIYVGILKPNGAVESITASGTSLGTITDLSTLTPLLRSFPLTAPFSALIPNYRTWRWTNRDQRGQHVLFVAATVSGALDDGVLAESELLSISTTPFSLKLCLAFHILNRRSKEISRLMNEGKRGLAEFDPVSTSQVSRATGARRRHADLFPAPPLVMMLRGTIAGGPGDRCRRWSPTRRWKGSRCEHFSNRRHSVDSR